MMVADSVLLATVLLAAVTDLLERRIYNALTFPVILLGIILHAVALPGAWWEGLAGLFAVGIPFFALYAVFNGAIFGAGDVKLLMAVGALAGWRVGLTIGVVSIVVGGALSLVTLLGAGRLGDVVRVFRPGASPEDSLKAPFGLAIAVAAVTSVAALRLQ